MAPIERDELFKKEKRKNITQRAIFDFLKSNEDEGYTIDEIIDLMGFDSSSRAYFEKYLNNLVKYRRVNKITKDNSDYYIIIPGKEPLPHDLTNDEKIEKIKNNPSYKIVGIKR